MFTSSAPDLFRSFYWCSIARSHHARPATRVERAFNWNQENGGTNYWKYVFFDRQKGKMGSTNLNVLVFELGSGPLLEFFLCEQRLSLFNHKRASKTHLWVIRNESSIMNKIITLGTTGGPITRDLFDNTVFLTNNRVLVLVYWNYDAVYCCCRRFLNHVLKFIKFFRISLHIWVQLFQDWNRPYLIQYQR